jgi:S-adenosylmethionine hydrolase
MPMSIISLTTDFGVDSPYVAQMKGAILSVQRSVQLVDITHSIPPQDILAGAIVLHDTCPVFPAGTIHIAVVDPGVGTARGIVAVRSAATWFIAPDNGLLSGIARRNRPDELRRVENRQLWRSEVSSTFHGRDIMAPVAAHLAAGGDPAQIGPKIDRLIELPWPEAKFSPKECRGEVIAVDSFGNLITSIFGRELATHFAASAAQNEGLHIEIGDTLIRGLSGTYGQAQAGQIVALIGSSDRLEIAEVGGSAARTLRTGRGTPVAVRP